MIFLIEYNKKEGKIITLRSYESKERRRAEKDKLKIELSQLKNGLNDEIVLLEAKDQDAIRVTHRRYFENLADLIGTW